MYYTDIRADEVHGQKPAPRYFPMTAFAYTGTLSKDALKQLTGEERNTYNRIQDLELVDSLLAECGIDVEINNGVYKIIGYDYDGDVYQRSTTYSLTEAEEIVDDLYGDLEEQENEREWEETA